MMSRRPSRNPSRLLPGLLAFALIAGGWCEIQAQSVTLQLRNGDRLTGTIIAEENNQVTLKTSWFNVVVIPVGEIRSRENAPAEPLLAPAPLAAKPPAASIPPPPPPVPVKGRKEWSGEAQLGTDMVFSDKDRQLFTGRIKATYTHDQFRNFFDYLFAYGRNDGVLTDNRMQGSSKSDLDVGKRLYVYNLAGAGYDEIRKIDLQFDVGPGVGYHLIRLARFAFDTEFGATYQGQYQTDGLRTEQFYFRWAENASWKVNGRFSVDEKFEYFPRIDEWGQYRFRFEANLRYTLLGNLSLILTTLDQYDTLTAPGVSPNTLEIRSSLGLKF